MTDEELRLQCIIAASMVMSKKAAYVFNKETYRCLDNPICLADIYLHYVKTGSLTYLSEEELTLSAEPTRWENAIAHLEKENAKLTERLKPKGFQRFLQFLR